MAQPEREIRGLRNDLREACTLEVVELQHLVSVLEAVNADADEIRAATQQLHGDLSQGSGLPVSIAGQSQAVETLAVGGGAGGEAVEVSNLLGVEEAVLQDAETVNAGLWGIAGLFAGFLLLAVVFKLVRP